MTFVDTHIHLYLPEFEQDINSLISTAREAGVERFYLPAIDSAYTKSITSLVNKFPEYCFPMAGLHPCSVKENFEEELDVIYKQLTNENVIAIGETGLDFYWDKTFEKQQYIALEKQLEWALKFNLPIVLHTRNATRETIITVQPFAEKGLRGIFHCFGSNIEDAKDIIAMGFYLGIGGVLTYKNSGLDKILSEIDIKHLVLETDAPYLSPVPFRGKRNEPRHLKLIAEKLAEINQIPLEKVAEITTENANQLFSFH